MYNKIITFVSWATLYTGLWIGISTAINIVFTVDPQSPWEMLVGGIAVVCSWSVTDLTIGALQRANEAKK